jgi:hypothetical protein
VRQLQDGYAFVHYEGWNTSHDEWLPFTSLMEINEKTSAEYSRLKHPAVKHDVDGGSGRVHFIGCGGVPKSKVGHRIYRPSFLDGIP